MQQEKKQRLEEIEAVLEAFLPREEGLQQIIMEAMNYSLRAGGKRLRPMLMQETFQMFGGQGRVIEPFMAAMEMIHTYSLVHDDLPAMDNDDYRRGKLTTHKKFGEDIGVLAGDALLNYSMETALQAFQMEKIDVNAVASALQVLYKKAGIYGMIGGQTVDVLADKHQEVTREKLDFIYELKTGALIEASMMIGAILAGAKEKDVQKIESVAKKVGLAFQIQDDILDITSTLEELGKPVGSDEKNEKVTYVTYEGLEKAAQDVKALSEEAIQVLDSFEGEHTFLKELIISLINRKN